MIALGGLTAAVVAVPRPAPCGWCDHRATMMACRCTEPCKATHCLHGEPSYDQLPGTIHDIVPVPRFVEPDGAALC